MTSQQTDAHTSFYEQLHRKASIKYVNQCVCRRDAVLENISLSFSLSLCNNLLHRDLFFIAFNNHHFYLSLYTSSDMSINSFCSADLFSIFLVPQFFLILSFCLHNSHSPAIHLWVYL